MESGMHNFQTTSTQSLMDRYYEEEKAQQERELSLAELNVRLDANDLAMLNVISKRFRKTRDEVAQELLSSALIDLFSRLETTERRSEEHTSELQSRPHLVCRLLLEKKKTQLNNTTHFSR